MDYKTNNGQQNTTENKIEQHTSCSASGNPCVTHVLNLMRSHESGKKDLYLLGSKFHLNMSNNQDKNAFAIKVDIMYSL